MPAHERHGEGGVQLTPDGILSGKHVNSNVSFTVVLSTRPACSGGSLLVGIFMHGDERARGIYTDVTYLPYAGFVSSAGVLHYLIISQEKYKGPTVPRCPPI